MYRKILVANRGEIAVRIIRTLREMGIWAISLYTKKDQHSLHVRLADECVQLPSPDGFMDVAAIIQIAQETQADAIHPGYGFLAEEASLSEACAAAGIDFIGPPAPVIAAVRDKLEALRAVQEAGFPTVACSPECYDSDDLSGLFAAADELKYPLVVKSCRGGRGPAERLVNGPKTLEAAVRRAQAESRAVYGSRRVFLEKAILPAHQVTVQVLGDTYGQMVHLGEREGSLLQGHRKLIEESPAPNMTAVQRAQIWETAVAIARLMHYENVGTVEFLLDETGQFYFTEIKSRIQVEHSLTEMVTRIDLVREQVRIAAGERLAFTQEDVTLRGWAMMCRVRAADPWNHFLPSPGQLQTVNLPGGPEVRVDTYVYDGCHVPAVYDPLLANLVVWGPDRESCLRRMTRALEDFKISGRPTNLPLLQRLCATPAFAAGVYNTDLLSRSLLTEASGGTHMRDLATAVAILYLRRHQRGVRSTPARLQRGWHRNSRRLPQ